jgi:hypothetical protein
MFVNDDGPQWSRPDREPDFSLMLNKDDESGDVECNVDFWITKIISQKNVELLYAYDNNCHGKTKASFCSYKDDGNRWAKIRFKHRPESDDAAWGDDEQEVVTALNDVLTRQIEEALGL